ncbi:MAG: lytic murein transglycosylase [Hyphomonadaceae bacterium]|nr:lytic murein transglycosylase [Hyphomonadaceae bacterium]
MQLSKASLTAAVVAMWAIFAPAPAQAQQSPYPPPAPPTCRNTGSFESWLQGFRKEALDNGISRATVAQVLDGMTLDSSVIARDRKQGFFAQSFLAFSDKLISQNRIQNGIARLKQHRDLFAKVEKEYGVPAPVIAAFWALESDYGSVVGKLPILRALATLAYDCRRPDMFRAEFMDALRIIDRGDLTAEEMIGSWAGELGQTQFLPSHYLKHAIDYDGDGRRNLITSIPDVIGSSANFIAHLGWQRGQPWLEEVQVPGNLAWEEADLAVQHPRAKWAGWGVTRADGRPLPADALPASLVLPMGRHGPAFLAYENFRVYLKWNHSLNYCLTAAYLATRLAGAPPMSRGSRQIPELSMEQVKELQQLLARRGLEVGEIDGKLGAATRSSVKAAQIKLGLPADSYPTVELIERLRGQR